MITISLCMIVKNEEDVIERCLSCVRDIADEIIIVDTGSGDRTKECAAKFTDKIFDFEWCDDFSAARNFSFAQAGMDYIMWLDADDIILPDDIKRIIELKATLPADTDAVMMRYNTGFNADGSVNFYCFRERLLRRAKGFKWEEPVHECLHIGGKIIKSDICITHAKKAAAERGRNILIFEKILERGGALSPRGMYYYARELREHGRYEEAAELFCEFLALQKGWVEDNINACECLAECFRAQKKPKEELAALLRSLSFGTPRAELCCQLGYWFKQALDFATAAFWFELALNVKPGQGWGFQRLECAGYIPCIELAVCYDRLGDYEKAERYNDKAGEHHPESSSFLYNKKYFSDRR